MMNIKEYFDNLYKTATTDEEWEKINEYEHSVYEMEEGFEEWAEEHNIDLTAMGTHGISILQYWAWNFED